MDEGKGIDMGRMMRFRTRVERDKNPPEQRFLDIVSDEMYWVKAICPYCNEAITYRQVFPPNAQNVWLGVGCPKCNKRIKVSIP